MLNDFGYIDKAIANIKEVAEKQEANIKAAAKLMADAIAADKLINVYAGGGHTTLAMGEMFFRAGGLANINPLMETALSVFNQAAHRQLRRIHRKVLRREGRGCRRLLPQHRHQPRHHRRGGGVQEARMQDHSRRVVVLAEGNA